MINMDLAVVLQRLYDSEINVTITMLWDGGFDFALISYMEWDNAGRPIDYSSRSSQPNPTRALIVAIPGITSTAQISSPRQYITQLSENIPIRHMQSSMEPERNMGACLH